MLHEVCGMLHDDRGFLVLSLLVLLFMLVCGAIGAVIAHVKNQSVREGLLLGAFLGIYGVIAVAREPRKPKTQTPSGVSKPGWYPDPAGIGPDIALMSWLERSRLPVPAFVLYGDPQVLLARARALGAKVPIATVPGPREAATEFADALPARVDPQQLRQAIWNLCINAVQAMPEGGEMRVGGRLLPGRKPARMQLWVSDTGPGIAEGDLPQIFEPFFSTKAEGSGIGLALVYRVVQDHDGQIEVRSQPGVGTTFLLMLPSTDGAV